MLENLALGTVKLKKFHNKVSYLPSYIGLFFRRNWSFQNIFYSFIDLELHFDLSENEC